MNESDKDTDQFVTVEAPVRIEPGQNLYDQPPFNLVIAHVTLTKGLSVEQIKALLAKLSKYSGRPELAEEQYRSNGSGALFAERTISGLGSRLNLGNVTVHGKLIPTREGIQSGMALLRDLAPYPWWFSYVRHNVGSLFLNDGSWNQRASPQPVDSYAIWVQKRLERNQDLVLTGIEKVFPQDFRTTSTSIVVSRRLVSQGVTSLGVLQKRK